MASAATGAAPGKVILFGEHAVVHGRPAVAAAIGRGLGAVAEPDPNGPVLHIPAWGRAGLHVKLHKDHKEFDAIARAFDAALKAAGLDAPPVAITLDGELPPGVGLGSSAAFAVALLRVLGDFRGRPFPEDELLAAAWQVETVFHGTPSGLDHTVVTLGGCLRFQRQDPPRLDRVPLGRAVPLVVAWAPREGNTRELVARLRERREAHPALYDRLFDGIGEVTEAGIGALGEGDLETLGVLFDLNHGYLNACGVSSLANEQMVSLARRHGALGAKLTGAGGGGAVIALTPEDPQRVVDALIGAGFRAFSTTIEG